MWRCGLRVSEALALRVCDVDGEAGCVRVLRGKGGKSRVVGIDVQSVEVLGRWLERREKLGIVSDQLFCTLGGRPLISAYVRSLLSRLGRKAGLSKRVHAHGLRHTHAAELRAEGVDIGVISKQLGHASIATTARCLDHICPQQVIDTIRSRTW
jgi:site-specific recombinase XerD